MTTPNWDRAKWLSLTPNQKYSLSIEKRQLLFWCAAAAPDGPHFVEIGVCHGGTAMLLAYVAKCRGGTYLGVDNWSLEGSYEEVRRALDLEHLREPAVELVAGDSTVLEGYRDPIDLLLIDGGHQIGVVDRDCERWIPLVRPGGLVCFDDYTGKLLPREEDCHWAVRESAEHWTEEWWTVGFWEGLLVRRKPE